MGRMSGWRGGKDDNGKGAAAGEEEWVTRGVVGGGRVSERNERERRGSGRAPRNIIE